MLWNCPTKTEGFSPSLLSPGAVIPLASHERPCWQPMEGLIGVPWYAVLGGLGVISQQIRVEQNQSQSPHPYQALSKHLIFHNAFSNALFSQSEIEMFHLENRKNEIHGSSSLSPHSYPAGCVPARFSPHQESHCGEPWYSGVCTVLWAQRWAPTQDRIRPSLCSVKEIQQFPH